MKNIKSFSQHLNESYLSPAHIRRMEGLVNRNHLKNMLQGAHSIMADLTDEGFEEYEMAEFIKLKITQELEDMYGI